MNKANLEQFLKQVAGNEDFQVSIGEEISGETLIALGTKHGFAFCPEDLGSSELSDTQLDGVAEGFELSEYALMSSNSKFKMMYQPHGDNLELMPALI